ncbi:MULTISPECIES: hypothetical protein [Pelosinus]|uniref:Uncharacterized protein n=1 Tax=Pelosinus fermentans B4 TaxID=1149862 RepID=I9L6D7_9FIRM|nr:MULTISPECIES: hypothetical protein [Pelosinus]EIW15796.1 hypothetical protein FB4_1485 [Pelosinus fermentans B4]EIW27498.1 hypothetical protein FA11_1517 [Pelosinus fermentans A11]
MWFLTGVFAAEMQRLRFVQPLVGTVKIQVEPIDPFFFIKK